MLAELHSVKHISEGLTKVILNIELRRISDQKAPKVERGVKCRVDEALDRTGEVPLIPMQDVSWPLSQSLEELI